MIAIELTKVGPYLAGMGVRYRTFIVSISDQNHRELLRACDMESPV